MGGQGVSPEEDFVRQLAEILGIDNDKEED